MGPPGRFSMMNGWPSRSDSHWKAGLLDGKPGRLLVADVKVDLAAIIAGKDRAAAAVGGRRRVVEHRDHGLVPGECVRQLILVGHVAKPGELVAVAVLRAADDVRHRSALRVVLLAVEEQPAVGRIEAETGRRIIEGVGVGQIRRAEPAERHTVVQRRIVIDISLRRGVEQPYIVHEIVAGEDLQARLVDDPLGDESAVGPVGAHRAGEGGIAVRDFMVHQYREGAVSVVEGAETVGDADHGIAVERLISRRDQRLDVDMRVGTDEIGCLRARRPLDLAGNDELLGVKIGELRVFDHQLIAAAERDDDVVVGWVRRIEDRLKRGEIEVTNVDAVAGLQVRNGVGAGALADEEGIVVGAADQHVLARTAEQQVSAAAADEVVLARLADQGVVAASAEEMVVAVAAENQIVAAPTECMVISAPGENGVVPVESEEDFALFRSVERVVTARSELESRFDRHLPAPALRGGRLASVARLIDNRVTPP